jgi:hypothetical protein
LPGKDRTTAYNFVLDKFKYKLSTSKADKLSHAARLTLIKSVFSSIPVYYMSNILFIKKFIAKLTAIIRSFWWTGVREETNSKALCLRAWKDICTPKDEGGLGIRNIQAMNQALILMAAWRIADQLNELLHAVLKAKYFPDSSIWRPKPNTLSQPSGPQFSKFYQYSKTTPSTRSPSATFLFGAPPGVNIGTLSVTISSCNRTTLFILPMSRISGSLTIRLGTTSSLMRFFRYLWQILSSKQQSSPHRITIFYVENSCPRVNVTQKVLTGLVFKDYRN